MKLQCPICSSTNVKQCSLSNLKSYKDYSYDLNHCNRCDMEFWTPLELVSEIYSEEYLDSYKDIHSGSSGLGTNMNLFINNNGNNIGSLIDIGCGNGLFIDKLRSRDFTVKGIDLDEKSIEYCRKLNLDVYNQHLDSFISENPEFIHTFDYITFFEVLEHQDNPLQFLSIVKSLLKPSGKIAFSVPDRNKVTTKMFKLYGLFSDPNKILNITKRDFPPHHFLWFNQKVLRYILAKIGCVDIRFIPISYTKDAKLGILNVAVQKLSKTLSLFFPNILLIMLSKLPLGWNYSIYCEARLESNI